MSANKINIVLDLNKATKLFPFLSEEQIIAGLTILEDNGLIKSVDEFAKTKLVKVPAVKAKRPELEEFIFHAMTKLEKHPVKLNSQEVESFKFEVENKFNTYSGNSWRDGNNKPIKNWKATLSNQIKWLVNGAKVALTKQNTNKISSYTEEEVFDLFIEDAQGKFKTEVKQLYKDYALVKGALFDLSNMFRSHLVGIGTIHVSSEEFFRHFKNWLRVKDQNNGIQNYKTHKTL